MTLISKADIQQASKVQGRGGELIANVAMRSLKLDEINLAYDQAKDKTGVAFLTSVLDSLGIEIVIPEEELARIPKTGAFITVSNHPYGGLDGLILLKILKQIRPDYKVLANHLLKKVDPLSDSIIAVNPFESAKDSESNIHGIRTLMTHLQEEKPLGIFPAGEVSRLQLRQQSITDREWEKQAIKVIRKAKVPVVPIYFHGVNSLMFHLLGMIHGNLQTAKLPSELLNKRNKKIQVRIGKPIDVEKQWEFDDTNEFGRYLRAKTYYLGQPLKVNSFFKDKNLRKIKPEPIIAPVPHSDLIIELSGIPDEDLLFSFRNFEIYCTKVKNIPNILKEIGRLREVSFRIEGEGTNKSCDLDEYDLYYQHLFIWDTDKESIAGAYRVGLGKDIFHQYGKRGFYIHSLFRIKNEFSGFLKGSVELGRSFVAPEYQKNPYALFLLWKGILYYVLKHQDLKYIIGPVSISNRYNQISKALMIDFVQAKYYDHAKAAFISPRNRFRYKKSKEELKYQLQAESIKDLESLIEEMEPSHFKLPILLKKYLKQNAKIIGFNVDPRFNKALDGLMYLDIGQVNLETIKMLAKEVNDPTILDRFGYSG